jgi:drug/metabolite transporter (DMT)-like permease
MAGVAAGMALFFVGQEAPQTTAPDPGRGDLLAALSGVAWGGTVLGLRWIGRHPAEAGGQPALVTVVAGNVLACLVCLPLALPVADVSAADVGVVAFLGVVQIGLAYLALATAMPHVPALEASTLLLVEPALNPVWAWLAHGERPRPLAWVGGAVIVGAAMLKTWWDARRVGSIQP